ATFFSNILTDNFSAITVPSPFHSAYTDSVVTWNWKELFLHPTTGSLVELSNLSVPANRYVIYAGARSQDGSGAGVGGAGGYRTLPVITGSGTFGPGEGTQLNTINDNFNALLEFRGQPSGFARWGGSITFDTSARTWNFDHTTLPSAGQTDFYSI